MQIAGLIQIELLEPTKCLECESEMQAGSIAFCHVSVVQYSSLEGDSGCYCQACKTGKRITRKITPEKLSRVRPPGDPYGEKR